MVNSRSVQWSFKQWRNRFHDGRHSFWTISLFTLGFVMGVFLYSSIAAWLKCGCVDLSVSVTFQCGPHLLPFLCDELTLTFNDSFQRRLIRSCHIPNGRRCRFVFSFSRCRFYFVFLYIWASFGTNVRMGIFFGNGRVIESNQRRSQMHRLLKMQSDDLRVT